MTRPYSIDLRERAVLLRHLHVHGTESGVRGGRAIEAYGNDTTFSFVDTPGTLRSGCLLFYNNTWHGTAMNNPPGLASRES